MGPYSPLCIFLRVDVWNGGVSNVIRDGEEHRGVHWPIKTILPIRRRSRIRRPLSEYLCSSPHALCRVCCVSVNSTDDNRDVVDVQEEAEDDLLSRRHSILVVGGGLRIGASA